MTRNKQMDCVWVRACMRACVCVCMWVSTRFVGRLQSLFCNDNALSHHINLMYANVAAVNTVLKSLELKAGDAILVYSWTYSAIRNACDATAQKTGMIARMISFFHRLVLSSWVVGIGWRCPGPLCHIYYLMLSQSHSFHISCVTFYLVFCLHLLSLSWNLRI